MRIKSFSKAIGKHLLTTFALSTLLALSSPQAQEQPAATDSGVTLNLKDADISSLISTVSEVTGRNFIIDPRVKAKITIVSSKSIAKDELYDVFLSILQVHGFAAIEVGTVTKIVPDVIAKQGPIVDTGVGDELVTRVIPVFNVSAVQLIPILRPLIPQQAHMAAYPQSNVLVVSDHAINIDRIVEVVRRIDQADESQEIEVIPLKHAAASEVVRVLNTLRSAGAVGTAGSNLSSQTILSADERSNSVLMTGDKTDRLRIRGIIAHLDTPTGGTGATNVVFLNYSSAEELAPILQAVSTTQTLVGVTSAEGATGTRPPGSTAAPRAGSTGASSNSDIGIEADPRNNALIITAPPEKYAGIKAVIDRLDVRRAQVLVEAIIAEVSVNLTRDLGVQFAALGEQDSRGIVGTNFGGAGNSIVQLIQDPFTVGQGLSVAVGKLGNSTNFGVLLRALAGDAETNILSTPSLVTLDNEEAEVIVAQNVPFITGSFTNTGTGGGDTSVNPFQTIEREDVGLTLRITPQINEGDSIRLSIETESSSLAATPSGVNASDLITNTRSIKTNVLVEDGQLVILGGLIEDNATDSVQKVPVLGDIPLLGHLFQFSSKTKNKRNLMTFIRPVILRDAATAAAYTSEKYQYLRAQQLDAQIRKSSSGTRSTATLPNLDALITEPPQIKPSGKP